MSPEELKERYPTSHHAPDPNCRFCHGEGVKPMPRMPGEVTACICIYVDHKYAYECGKALSSFAKKELAKLDAIKG